MFSIFKVFDQTGGNLDRYGTPESHPYSLPQYYRTGIVCWFSADYMEILDSSLPMSSRNIAKLQATDWYSIRLPTSKRAP
ncbi:hypothetical protein NPIL_584651, partial [Nephila pilipes]